MGLPAFFGTFDVSKADVTVRQHTLVLSMEKNLQQRELGVEQLRDLVGFDFQQITVNVANQHLGRTEGDMPLSCFHATCFRQLPGFLSPVLP